MTMRRTTSPKLLAALALALAGCDASMPWSTPSGPAPQDQGQPPDQGSSPVTPASLTFRGWLGGPAPAAQALQVASLPAGTYLRFEALAPAVRDTSLTDPPAGAAITMVPPDQVGLGTHQGSVIVQAGWVGGAPFVGSPWTVPCTYVVGPPALEGLPASLTVEQLLNGPTPDPVLLHLDGAPGAGPWTVSVRDDWGSPTWLQVAPSRGSALPAVVSLQVIRAPASASAQDTARVVVSRAGQDVEVPVTRRIRYPGLLVDSTPIALSIEANQAERPSFAVRVDTELGAPVGGVVSVSYDPPIAWGDVGWLSYSWDLQAPQDVPFALATTALTPGRHVATLNFDRIYVGSSAQVQVTLDVAAPPASLSPTALLYRLGASATAASLEQSLVLDSLGDAVAWTASADVPWLRVTPAGATSAGGTSTLSVAVVPEALETLRCLYGTGNVTVAASARGGRVYTYRAAVSLELDLPCLVGFGPSADVEGNAASVAFVGLHLGDAAQAMFGDLAVPIDPALARWGELRVVPPPLPPGTYRVTIPNALGFAIGSATYRVAAARSPSAAAVAAPGRKVRLVADDANGWLWAINSASAEVERWDLAEGLAHQRQAIPGLKDAAPLPDGATWLALAGAELSTFEAATFPSALPIHWGWAQDLHATLAAPIDGHVLLAVDPVACAYPYPECYTEAWDPMTRWRVESSQVLGARLGASRSGVRMAIGDDTSTILRRVTPWWAGSSSYGGGGPLPLGDYMYGPVVRGIAPEQLALDRHGDRILLLQDGSAGAGRSQLLDSAGLVVPGQLPATIATVLLTQAADRAVAFDGVSRKVRIFDLLGGPDPVTGLFLEADLPGGLAPVADPGAAVVMALSADDRTLYLGGDERIVVVPLP